ncbi:PIR protein [Plasmodium vivax]|nr:PIR protein [Plasmodium vivax]
MTIEKYEANCHLSKFIKRVKDKSYYESFENMPQLQAIVDTNKDIIKSIGCGLYSGYNYLSAFPDNKERTDFCNYLNLWLDEQKSIYVKDKNEIIDGEWKYIEKIWEGLPQVDSNQSRICERQKQEKFLSDIIKRINLLTYCANRDCIKKFCKYAIRSKRNIEDRCQHFTLYTNKSYKELTQDITCLDNIDRINSYKYHISDECTLYNVSKTFPVFDLESQTILESDSVRPTIQKCGIPPKVEDGNSEPSVEVADVPPETSEPGKVLTESEDALTESKFRHPGQEVDLAVPPVLFHPPSADANLTDNGHSKPIYYAGLSVSGAFFTSMVLYKYTALGPLIRSLVSKKEKLRKTTNKHLAQQWLQTTSEYMDSNSENSHYNFPYQSMQN